MHPFMSAAATRASRFIAPTLVALITFLIGYVHHRWFFARDFHADAAAMQVLAKAMIDQHSLLPTDFGYGNQLILFRSSPFIALALLGGAAGYQAFIIGSALSIAFWSLVLYAMLRAYTHDRLKASVVTVLFMIPMGVWDHDYILGQQSHLSNVVLSAGAALATAIYCTRRQAGALALAALCIFLMSAEAPIRALLVLLPLSIGVFVYGGAATARRVAGLLLLALVIGVVTNRALMASRPLGLNLLGTMTFRSIGDIILTLQQISLEMLGAISSVNIFAANPLRAASFLLYAAGLAYLLAICGYAAWRANALFARVRQAPAGLAGAADDFTAAIALLGVLIGSIAVATLKPDTARHILWAGALLRLSFILFVYGLASKFVRTRARLVALLAIAALLPSFWFATLSHFRGLSPRMIELRIAPPINGHLRALAEQLKIHEVFGGDFWRMHSLNATVPGIAAGTLVLQDNDSVVPDYWLSRRSLFNPGHEVLYYLKGDKADKAIEAALARNGGRRLYAMDEESIWIGKPVWATLANNFSWKGCELSTLTGVKTADCAIQNRAEASSGFLTFGPYVDLAPGKYLFALDYRGGAAPGTTVGEWEVVVLSTAKLRTLGSGSIKGTLDKSGRVTGNITIERGAVPGRLEVRTVAYPTTRLAIEGLRIARYACDNCPPPALP